MAGCGVACCRRVCYIVSADPQNCPLWLTELTAVKILLSQPSLPWDKIRAATRRVPGDDSLPTFPHHHHPPQHHPQPWWMTSHFPVRPPSESRYFSQTSPIWVKKKCYVAYSHMHIHSSVFVLTVKTQKKRLNVKLYEKEIALKNNCKLQEMGTLHRDERCQVFHKVHSINFFFTFLYFNTLHKAI